MFAKDAEINIDVVIKKLNEILAVRGKKGTDRVEQVDLLVELMGIAQLHNLGDSMHCKILFSVISAIFDYNSNVLLCMRSEMWGK
jgi:translation initiation factor 3 subunit C